MPPADQLPWFRRNVYPHLTELHLDQDVSAMTWDQVRGLADRGHRICSHAFEHVQISGSTAPGRAEREIVESRVVLTDRLGGIPVEGFCWPIRFDPRARTADALVRATYRYALCGESRLLRPPHDPFRTYRTNIEVSWPLDVVDLQLSGITDVWFSLRRLRERRHR
jgi:peptidoglycan/xylan/chitin deacetylase (PgdA/CDA1 family)